MNEGNQNQIKDKIIECCDCARDFTFSKGEQLYYQSKMLSTPRHCKSCRDRRRKTIVPDMDAIKGVTDGK